MFLPGSRLTDGTALDAAFQAPQWAVGALVATASNYPLVTSTITNVSVGADGLGVKLPPPVPGNIMLVRNASVHNLFVYCDRGTVGGMALGYDQSPGSKVIYVALSATAWVIFSNPASFGSYYSDQIQTNSLPANTMTLNQTIDQAGFSVMNGSRVRAAYPGIYNIQFSAQVVKTDAGTDDIQIWLAKNGQDVAVSNTLLSLSGNNAKAVAAWNFMIPLDAGDYFELKWYSADAQIFLNAIAAGARPAVPSLILTVQGV